MFILNKQNRPEFILPCEDNCLKMGTSSTGPLSNRANNASNSRLTASKACLRPFGGKDSAESLQSISSVKCSNRANNASNSRLKQP